MASPLAVAEVKVSPKFETIGVFKNGLAVTRVSFLVNGAGKYFWDEVPQMVHGSLWVESDAVVDIHSTTRMVKEANREEAPIGVLQKDLAGQKVKVMYNSGENKVLTAVGSVWVMPAKPLNETWDTNYRSLIDNNRHFYPNFPQQSVRKNEPTTGSFLVLEEDSGERSYLQKSNIISISLEGAVEPKAKDVEKQVLVFDVKEAPKSGGVIHISYLTKGLAWFPSYNIDLSDPESLKIRQNAVVRNEMGEVKQTELQLISGYPSIRFGAVNSTMSVGSSLSAFFQQIQGLRKGGISTGVLTNSYTSQVSNANIALPDVEVNENVSGDIHYESIGKRDMKVGDSLSLDVANAESDYERVVEWVVLDTRDDDGCYRSNDRKKEDAWDAICFTNPFSFPMTTAAATIVENGKFRGQSLSTWVNPGQKTSVKITRALSIQTSSNEFEEEGERKVVFIGRYKYYRTNVTGNISVRNFRSEDTIVTIRRDFSGYLIEADGNPKKSLRVEGAKNVNPCRQLDWKVTIPAGEKIELTYRYHLLVK